jgi:cytochrome c-type biogenesis protein CcmH/NrfG
MTDPDREQLIAERDFLLTSLDDLEQERASGGIDEESYRALHDDYTARAAAAIRALEQGGAPRPARAPVSARRRWLVIGGIVAFVVLAGTTLAFALGARLPGQTASGNSQASASNPKTSQAAQRKRLEAAVAAKPNDTASRMLLARYLEADNDLEGALKQYDAVIAINPNLADAYAESGRIFYLTATRAPNADAAGLVAQATTRIDHALQLSPDDSDAHFFRAIIRANEYADFLGAQDDLQRYLVAQPNGTFAGQARQLLEDVTNALEPATTTTSRPASK